MQGAGPLPLHRARASHRVVAVGKPHHDNRPSFTDLHLRLPKESSFREVPLPLEMRASLINSKWTCSRVTGHLVFVCFRLSGVNHLFGTFSTDRNFRKSIVIVVPMKINFVPEQPVCNRCRFVVSPITKIRGKANREKFQLSRIVHLDSVDIFVFQRVAVLIDRSKRTKSRTTNCRRLAMPRVALPSVSLMRSPSSILVRVPSCRSKAA